MKPIVSDIYMSPDYSRVWEEDYANGDPNRASQEDAGYVEHAGGEKTCSNCVFFRSQTPELGTCIMVKGVISADGHSKFWADRNTGTKETKQDA